ncbi:DUF1573 domain-containing protein [Tundrisphaera sp. TA3]|uniref:DUF1573 domain-containing protein n=1 Tax=Tundrisphaera sp. TA3 TaxID=3435775 RepID=UPI003EB810BE
MRLALLAAVAIAAGCAWPAGAADWTDAVFPDRSHDFGTVARGSKVHHSFRLVNSTDQEIHIAAWRTKCGCTEVTVGAKLVPPGTQTTINAVIDTTKFTGYKASGLTLVIDRPQFQEIDLNLTCFIRGDLTLTPGQVDFGVANRSTNPTRELTLSYAGGQADWAILEVKTISDHIVGRLQESGRSPGGQVNYVLTATLRPSAPIGFLRDEFTLITNDPSSPRIPISVTANVQSNVTVSPSVMNLGRIRPGETVQKTIMVRSAQPFKVTGTKASRADLAVAAAPDQSRPMHAVNFTFKAPAQPGPYNAVIEVETDIKDEPPARLTAFATIVP